MLLELPPKPYWVGCLQTIDYATRLPAFFIRQKQLVLARVGPEFTVTETERLKSKCTVLLDFQMTIQLLSLPNEEFQLEEVNLPAELVRKVTGGSVFVDVRKEEQPRTKRVERDDVPLLIDPEGNYWNDYRPFRVLYSDDQSRVWRFRKIWLPGLQPPTENYVNCEQSPLKRAVSHEPLNLPTDWDLWEINIPWDTAHRAEGQQVEVEVHTSTAHPPKVFWRDYSGSLWRIPNDWRKRRILLPETDILVLQGVPTPVARTFGGQIVSVNYHPGSRCCLPDCYRFRDELGRCWPVHIEDCVVLSMGEHCETISRKKH